ncbi:MAG: ATP synthase F1 subunit gamma [Balneolaceae bacterium]
MANLRDIRNRITSVNNTEQITRAMKMVAAARLRKAQSRIVSARPYAAKMREVVGRLVSAETIEIDLLRQPESCERVLFLVIGSDRGLCGGFNTNLFKVVESNLKREWAGHLERDAVDMICVGRKAEAYFSKRGYRIDKSYPGFFDRLDFTEAVEVMEYCTERFLSGEVDRVELCFNEFKSVITQNRVVEKLLPVDPSELLGVDSGKDEASTEIDYIFEPDKASILKRLLPRYLNIGLWRALLESNASEQGARMAAMDNATENAKELKRELRLQYNRARQSAITTEISEIVSGAQALGSD